jgi:hypothetical protein
LAQSGFGPQPDPHHRDGQGGGGLGHDPAALEDELDLNKAGKEREQRARRELEAYTNLILARRRVEDFDRQGPISATLW